MEKISPTAPHSTSKVTEILRILLLCRYYLNLTSQSNRQKRK